MPSGVFQSAVQIGPSMHGPEPLLLPNSQSIAGHGAHIRAGKQSSIRAVASQDTVTQHSGQAFPRVPPRQHSRQQTLCRVAVKVRCVDLW